jgi:LPS-assembly lipoprotein
MKAGARSSALEVWTTRRRFTTRASRLTCCLLCLLVLSACGFRLAGSRPLPDELATVYIDLVTPYSVAEPPVETALQRLLRRRGAQVVGNAGEAVTTIRLSDLREEREVLSLGSDGKALEYQLITRINYAVLRDEQALMPPGSLRVTRDFSFNAQQVLAKEAEEERLRTFIQGELAELLMLRIEAALARARAPLDPGPAATAGDAAPR